MEELDNWKLACQRRPLAPDWVKAHDILTMDDISRSICAHHYWSVSQTQDSAYNVSYCPVSHTQLHSVCVCWAYELFSAWPLIFPYDLDTVIFHARLRTMWPMQHTYTLCHEGTCPVSIMLSAPTMVLLWVKCQAESLVKSPAAQILLNGLLFIKHMWVT